MTTAEEYRLWQFTTQAWIPLAGLACTVALGLFVWAKQPKTRLARVFVALNGAAALWNLDVFLLFTIRDEEVAGALDRLFQLPILSIPVLALFFLFTFLERSPRHPLLLAAGLWTAFLWWLSPRDAFLASWDHRWYGFYGRAGGLYLLFPLTVALYLLLSCRLLWGELRTTRDPLRRTQVIYLLAANAVLGIASLDNFGPLYGARRLPLGNIGTVPYFLIIAATIARHRLMDIRSIFRCGLLYSSLTFLLSCLYLGLVLSLQGWFQACSGSPYLPMVPSLAVAFAFIPLKSSLQESLDRRFFPTRSLMRSRLAELPALLGGVGSEKEVWRIAWEQGWSVVGPARGAVHVEGSGKPAPPKDDYELEIPVMGREGHLGCCLLARKKSDALYSRDEIAYLGGVAGQVAMAVERVRLLEEGRRRERLAALGKAAAFLSHEMRSPLNVIRGSVALLRPRLGDEETASLLSLVEEEIRRGERVISDFLSACRGAGSRLRPLDLGELLLRLADSAPGGPRGVRVRLEMPEGGSRVMGDLFQLRRLFENLFRNSAEAGAATVTVRCRPAGEGDVAVTVADDGPGIAASILTRLFEPLETTKGGGTGLGLAIARTIADSHGGSIEAENAAAGGAVFRLRLPAAPPEGAGSPLPGTCGAPERKTA